MVVEVRLFAMLRERVGSESVTVDVPEGATVREALDALGAQHEIGDLIGAMPVVMAVNREYAEEGDRLSAGDELALIPPVSGGEAPTFQTGAGYATATARAGRPKDS
jgi:molybdopterin converting factor subunit 1